MAMLTMTMPYYAQYGAHAAILWLCLLGPRFTMHTMAPQVAMIASRQMVWSYASVTCAPRHAWLQPHVP